MQQTNNKVFIGNIKFSTSKETLTEVFSQYGEVTDVSIPIYHDTRRPKGFAFITFSTTQAALDALKHNQLIDGREIVINKATPERKSHSNRSVEEEI